MQGSIAEAVDMLALLRYTLGDKGPAPWVCQASV